MIVILYGRGTCFVTIREEHSRRVLENRVLRSIFGHRRKKVTGYWRKLLNEKLRVIKLRRINMGGLYGTYRKINRGAYRVLVKEKSTWKT